MQIKDLLDSKPPTITVNTDRDVPDAMRLMIDNKISSLVVIDDDENPTGIITERDIFHLAHRYRGDMMDMKVGDCMSSRLITASPEDTLDKAAQLMTENHFRHLPIMDENQHLCGILSIGDILKAKLAQPAS